MYWTNGRAGRLLATTGFGLAVLTSLLRTSSAVAQEDVAPDGSLSADPYVVFVAQGEAFARCGPSGDFYRTDSLRHGQELEVYVETADGWLGIRPPADSFCWVPASSLELSGSSDQATVTEDHTVAWIGTHLGRARRYRWQVQLAEGEPVTILGKSERDGPDGPQMWYRIVPPSGEFRWVHRDQIVQSPEELVANAVADRNDQDTIEFLPSPHQERVNPRERLVRDERQSDDFQESESIAEMTPYQNGSSRRPERKSVPAGSFGQADPVQRTNDFRSEQSEQMRHAESNDQPVGSGVHEDWQVNAARGRAIDSIAADQSSRQAIDSRIDNAQLDERGSTRSNSPSSSSLSFRGSPRLQTIGSSYESMTPASTELANDSNWVGSGIRTVAAQTYAPDNRSVGAIRQTAAFSDPASMVRQSLHVVSGESVANVEAESRGADADKLQLMLSRVMAAGGSADEAEPIARAAEQLARTTADQLETRRAEAVVDRTRQYQRVAQRRDGNSVVQSPTPPMIPVSNRLSVTSSIPPLNPLPQSNGPSSLEATSPGSALNATAAAGDWISETGFLVQVYSARPNSPPFALTDHGGRTVAYVTPAPGTNVRMHLNNYVRVDGPRGFVSGMDTPHILVNRAQRVAE